MYIDVIDCDAKFHLNERNLPTTKDVQLDVVLQKFLRYDWCRFYKRLSFFFLVQMTGLISIVHAVRINLAFHKLCNNNYKER
jgi:hypothetical protein